MTADSNSNSSLSPEAQAQLAKLATDLAHNPKTRKKFVGLVREIDPTKRFPDVELDDIREELRSEREQEKQEREAEKIKIRLEAQKDALKSRYDDKAIEEIEKVMEKLGLSDYEAGATLYASNLKPATPTYQENDHRWELPRGIEMKDFGNLNPIRRQKAYQVIDELARNRTKAS